MLLKILSGKEAACIPTLPCTNTQYLFKTKRSFPEMTQPGLCVSWQGKASLLLPLPSCLQHLERLHNGSYNQPDFVSSFSIHTPFDDSVTILGSSYGITVYTSVDRQKKQNQDKMEKIQNQYLELSFITEKLFHNSKLLNEILKFHLYKTCTSFHLLQKEHLLQNAVKIPPLQKDSHIFQT